MAFIWEHPDPVGDFPWADYMVSGREGFSSSKHSHKSLAAAYTGDQQRLAVTALTGGSGALDGVVTAAAAVATGAIRLVQLGNALYQYRLDNGSDAESAPEVIRPDDFHSSTNARVWRLCYSHNRMAASGLPGVSSGITGTLSGVTLGTEALSLWLRVRVPVLTFASTVLAYLAPASGSNDRLELRWGTDGLVLNKFSGAGSSVTVGTYAGFAARWSDTLADIVVTRDPVAALWRVYLNGELVIESATGATENVASSLIQFTPGNVAAYRAVLFNRALTAGEVVRVGLYGIEAEDRWANRSAVLTPDWSAGVDSWVASSSTLDGNIDGIGTPSKDNVLRATTSGSPARAGARYTLDTALGGKRIRVKGSLLNGTGNTTDSVVVRSLTTGQPSTPATIPYNAVAALGLSNSWVSFRCELLYTNNLYLLMENVSGSGGPTTGDNLYLHGLTVEQVGALIDLDLAVGVGTFLPDLTTNGQNCALTLDSHLRPRTSGQGMVIRRLAHGDISATAGTSKLLDLPQDCALLRVELVRETAFDSGVTVELGSSGDSDRYFTAQAVDATGSVLKASLIDTCESASAVTAIYLKKSGATTVGSVLVRVIYELRGQTPPA